MIKDFVKEVQYDNNKLVNWLGSAHDLFDIKVINSISCLIISDMA